MRSFKTNSEGKTEGKLTAQKLRFIEALASGLSIAKAGEEAMVSPATSYRWSEEPEVVAKLTELQDASLTSATRLLSRLATTAAATLGTNMQSDRPASIQVRAALGILDQAIKLKTALELEGRVLALEKLLEVKEGEGDA